MEKVTIISKGNFTTPPSVQASIRNMLASSSNKEVFVKKDNEDNTYSAYQKKGGRLYILVGFYDELGNEI